MKHILLAAASVLLPSALFAQSAMDGYQLSRNDHKGTARFMAMGGAFGALGGDLSVLSYNPGGIGVYRNSEIGFTLNLDCQSIDATSQGFSSKEGLTRMLLNNIGVVTTWRLNSTTVPNLNFGFTYNKAASFNRQYKGTIPSLQNSMSNYIAGISNAHQLTVGDVETTSSYDPYNPSAGDYESPWISILGYDSYLTSPLTSGDQTQWFGQWGNGTSGSGSFSSWERGGVDEYNISFGGNINNVFFWGMDFGITDLNYTQETYWGENLENAYVETADQNNTTSSEWSLYNFYHVNGSGFNYKLGFIVKPIQELRLGFAFHTPTWYSLNEVFYADVDYKYGNGIRPGVAQTNDGYDAYNSYDFRTPWRIIVSAAGVIGTNFIISADYEWQPYNGMHFSKQYWSWSGNYLEAYQYVNQDIKDYYKATNSLRLGAEYRVTPRFSVRAGYAFTSSPAKVGLGGQTDLIETAGTRPQFIFDDVTNTVSCGLGYKYQRFYVDAAYVYKHRDSTFHAYTSDPTNPGIASPTAELKRSESQIVLSMGFKF